MNRDNPTAINKGTLRKVMAQAFNQEELKYVCDELAINIEDLAGAGKQEKIFELIQYLERRNRLPDLVRVLNEQRPDLDFTARPFPFRKRYMGGIVVLLGLLLLAAAWLIAQTGIFCPYHAATDYETIVLMIKAESQAVKEGNLAIIEEIFAADAYIKQTEKGSGQVTEWFDPLAHYSALFENTMFLTATHTDISGTVNGRYARFTSGGQGSYTKNGAYGEYDNKAGNPDEAELWTLQKNLCGCWQITEFEFH
ncbi:MAG: hypothetical protein H6667_09995 [Ardenticatenaceae bacterium]|nr:hypothetical protein [Ardenticatenaceae bacterium]